MQYCYLRIDLQLMLGICEGTEIGHSTARLKFLLALALPTGGSIR
jgi:hypothetical protein